MKFVWRSSIKQGWGHAYPAVKEGLSPFCNLTVTESRELLIMKTEKPYYVYSSGVLGDGLLITDTFYNRCVSHDYSCHDPKQEYICFLKRKKLKFNGVVGFMTAVYLNRRAVYTWHDRNITVTSVITAGIGNAVDILNDSRTPYSLSPGTINMFFFIQGALTNAAFLQAFISATEAKTKTLIELGITDCRFGTAATGTSTDSICIASSQAGKPYEYGGSLTVLGQAVAKLVKVSLNHSLIDS